MEKEEFKILVKGMKAVYADPKFIADKDAFDIWYTLLSDLDYDTTSMAIKKYMLTNKFPPTIADIRECVEKLTEPEQLVETEAWALVRNAIGNSAYNSTEEFAKLPPLVQKAVGLPEQLRIWAIDEYYNEAVASSNFIKSYRVILAREKELKQLPANMQNTIKKASESLSIEQKRNGIMRNYSERKQTELLEIKEDYVPMPERIKKKLALEGINA